MKKRFEKFQKCVAVIATIVMATGTMATGMTSMATDVTTTPEETLELLMNELKDSSEDRPEDLNLDFNGDGVVNVADAVILEKAMATMTTSEEDTEDTTEESENTTEELVEMVDWSHPGYFENPNDGVVYKFYKIYHVEPEHDFSKEYGHKPTAGVVCYPLEDGLDEGEKPEYVQTFEHMEDAMISGILIYEDEEYTYYVGYPYQNHCKGLYAREYMLRLIIHLEECDGWDVSTYDYNKNGMIDIGDVVIFNRIFWNTPWLWVTNEEYDYENLILCKKQEAKEFQDKLAFKVDWNEQDEDGGYWIRYGE